MTTLGLELAWIVVDDLKKAVKFYTEVVGLKLMELDEAHGWAELEGQEGGAKLGIAQKNPTDKEGNQSGQNAIVTFTVDNLEASVKHVVAKGASLIGAIQEVPGHVKMQTVQDIDNNRFQLVQLLQHHHHEGCCH